MRDNSSLYKTFNEVVSRRARENPDSTAYEYLVDGESVLERITYLELDRAARAVAAQLRRAVPAGSTAVLLLPPGLDFLRAFYGCLYANVIAVPTYPPQAFNPSQTLPQLANIVRDVGAAVILTTKNVSAELIDAIVAATDGSRPIRVDVEDAANGSGAYCESNLEPDALAFLQYTSGSTARPRGVRVTHGNLLANEEAIRSCVGQSSNDRVVSWLQLYHDMGLIGLVLYSVYAGIPCFFMSPLQFIQRPSRWLKAISRYKATITGGPNFGYDLCVRKVSMEDKAVLDLSSWRVAYNGAEPVRAETARRFSEAFQSSHFRPEAFAPSYGLAEATLAVTCSAPTGPVTMSVSRAAYERGRIQRSFDEADEKILLSSGRPVGGVTVAIVDPSTLRRCEEGAIGEIWVAGKSVTSGYWRSSADGVAFGNRLEVSDAGLFLRTGDLGFLDGDQLYVTGRLKDLVIVRGRKLYPHDIEQAVESLVPSVRPQSTIVFSIDGEHEEEVVVVSSLAGARNGDHEQVLRSIRKVVTEGHQAIPGAVVLIRAGTLPKTSSGKLARQACRRAFLDGTLKVVAQWPSHTA